MRMSYIFSIAILNGTCFSRSPGTDFFLVGVCYEPKYYNNNEKWLRVLLSTGLCLKICYDSKMCNSTTDEVLLKIINFHPLHLHHTSPLVIDQPKVGVHQPIIS